MGKRLLAVILILSAVFCLASCGQSSVTAAENEFKLKIDVETTDTFEGLHWKYYVEEECIGESYILANQGKNITKKDTLVITFIPEILPDGYDLKDLGIEFFVIPKDTNVDRSITDVDVITKDEIACNGTVSINGEYGTVLDMKMTGELDVGYSILPSVD